MTLKSLVCGKPSCTRTQHAYSAVVEKKLAMARRMMIFTVPVCAQRRERERERERVSASIAVGV